MTIGNRPPNVRADGRGPNDLRPVTFTLDVQKWAEGSCRIKVGDTEVLCAATIADRVPPHLRGKGTGWVTAEYAMLPRATSERTERESTRGRDLVITGLSYALLETQGPQQWPFQQIVMTENMFLFFFNRKATAFLQFDSK